jgi:hypothetical protein
MVGNPEVTAHRKSQGNRRSFTAFRMTVLWVEEMVPDEKRGCMVAHSEATPR